MVVCNFHVELGVGAEDVVALVGVVVYVELAAGVEIELTLDVAVLPREVDTRVDERVAVDVEPDEAD